MTESEKSIALAGCVVLLAILAGVYLAATQGLLA